LFNPFDKTNEPSPLFCLATHFVQSTTDSSFAICLIKSHISALSPCW